jgi:hypothetical protein
MYSLTKDLGHSLLFCAVQSFQSTRALPRAVLSVASYGISPGIEGALDLACLGNPKMFPRTESSAIRPIVVVLLGDADCSPPRDGLFGVGCIDWAIRGHGMVVSSCVHDELVSQPFSVNSIDHPDLYSSYRQLLA